MFCRPGTILIPIVVGQKHRNPPCKRWLPGLEAGLNQVVFPVSTRVGYVSNDVPGL
jgi:hypothetical protein